MGTLADIPYPESLTRFCEIRAYQILADFNSPMTTQEVEQVAIVAGELGELGTCKPRSILNGLSLAYRKVPRLRRRVARPKETGLKRSVYSYWISDLPRTEDDNSLRAPEAKREQHGRKGGYKQGHPGPSQPLLFPDKVPVAAPQAEQPQVRPWEKPPVIPVMSAQDALHQKIQVAVHDLNSLLAEVPSLRIEYDAREERFYATLEIR